jgi:hypothetical protein
LARIGKGQRALNRAHDYRDEIERMLADPWTRRYLPGSALDWFDSELRKNRFHLYTKEERRVFGEIVDEMKPFRGFGGLSIGDLIAVAVLGKANCAPDTEQYIDQLAADRPTELPLHHLRCLVNICRLTIWLPPFDGEFAIPSDPGDEEEKLERAEAALDKWAVVPVRRSA